jgi:hypothetical protein
MGWPDDGRLAIRWLAKPAGENINDLAGVSLLGYDGELDWRQSIL